MKAGLLGSSDAPATSDRTLPAWLTWLCGAALLFGLATSFGFYLGRDGFSEDEFFQLTFVNESLPQFFVQFVRLDQHPFFHFLQLKLWALVSQTDGWMLLNSQAWHLASCIIIFAVGRAWQGVGTGLLAAALYALLPQVMVASTTLRMYAMIPGLAVLSWWLNVALLSGRAGRAWVWAAGAVAQLALAYSHAIGFFFCAFISLAAALQVATDGEARPTWRPWLFLQAGCVLLTAPLVLLALARIILSPQGDSGGNIDPGGPMDHFAAMVSGWGMKWAWARIAGAAFFIAATVTGLWNQRTRWLAATILVGPYFTAFLVGMFLAPMFKTPVYSAMVVPFACLVLASGLASARAVRVVPPLLLAMAAFVVPATTHLTAGVSPYRTIADELRKRAVAGDVVIVAKPYLFWATVRYAIGPHWGSPLEVLPALNDSWQRVTKRLGPAAEFLHLIPRGNVIEHEGVRYVIGEDAVAAAMHARRVWQVQRPRYPETVKLGEGFIARGVVFENGRPETTQIKLHERPAPR